MNSSHLEVLSCDQARELALQAGARVESVCRVARVRRELRIGLSTIDPMPMVTLSGHGSPEKILPSREQCGPEQWDYHTADESVLEEHLLRVHFEGRYMDVRVLPAALAVMTRHGWAAGDDVVAPAMVSADELRAALHILREGDPLQWSKR